MRIIDLKPEYENAYCACLEEWSEEMKEAGDLKTKWLEKKKEQGLRVKLARNENDEIVGMIQYIPIENAPVQGKDLYYIYCVWVHAYKEGVGDHRKKGIGKQLLEAAEIDARELGAKGIVAWGIILPFFIRSKWFKKHGYKKVDRDGISELVWKPFVDDAIAPKMIKLKKRPEVNEEVLTVTCFRNGWCPAQNLSCERMKRVVSECDDKIKYIEIDTDDDEILNEWGIIDAIYIDKKRVNTGPPPSYKKLKKKIQKKVGKYL